MFEILEGRYLKTTSIVSKEIKKVGDNEDYLLLPCTVDLAMVTGFRQSYTEDFEKEEFTDIYFGITCLCIAMKYADFGREFLKYQKSK